jgi:hypothetical protein
MTRRLLKPALFATAFAVLPALLHAQYPMGGGMGGGMGSRGGMGRGGSADPNNGTPPPESKPRLPKSDDLVTLAPLLRGLTLTEDQKLLVRDLEEKYNPLLLPALDVVRTELENGKNADADRVSKYTARANRYREQQVAELRAGLTAEQLPRLEKNAADMRSRYGALLTRP